MKVKSTFRRCAYPMQKFLLCGLAAVLAVFPASAQRKGQKGSVSSQVAQKLQQERAGYQAPAGTRATTDLPGYANRLTATGNQRTGRTEGFCAAFIGSLAPGDLTMTRRLSRNLVAGTCPGPKTFPGSLTGNTYYDLYSWTNSSGLTQCATFSLSTADMETNIQFGVWKGSFNPANLTTNFLTDPGQSSGIPAVTKSCSANVAAGQTLLLVVFSPNTLQTASNYTLTVSMPVCFATPCSGTPDPGNTLSTATSACPGIGFALYLQNSTTGEGVTYQWQSASSASGPWSDIPGATNATLATSQSATTWYRCNVTCSGNTGSSNPVEVAMNPVNTCYCTPPETDCVDDMILRVRLNSLDNSSTCGSGPPAGYSNYTSTIPATTVYAGAANPVMVIVPTTYTEQIAVWIDYNFNGQFEAGEFTNLGSSDGTGGIVTGSINIPSSASGVTTRMRVRARFFTALTPTDACLDYTYGETEDYLVNIQPCQPIVITAQPQNTSTSCSGNTSFSVTTTGSLPVYRWQYRSSASDTWQYVPGTPPFSGERTNQLTLTDVSAAYNGYQFRVTVEGGCSALDFSAPATLAVTPLVATVNPVSAAICTGSVQQLTLTNAPVPYVFNSGPLALAIPDNTANGVSNSIAVSGLPALTPSLVAVKLNLTHTYPGDMIIHLKAPNGNILNLYKYNGGSFTGTDAVANAGWYYAEINSAATQAFSGVPSPFQYGITSPAGPYQPDALNTTVSGPAIQNPSGFVSNATGFSDLFSILNGNWTLALADGGPLDLGTLHSWSISFSFGLSNGVWNGPAGTMWTDAAGTVPYVAGSLVNSIYVTPAASSVYSVVYSTSSPCVSAPTTIPVTVVQPLNSVVNPANRSVCVGGSTTFTASASGGPLTYQWQLSTDGGLTYNNITGATASSYTVSGATLSMTGYRYRCVFTAAPCAGSAASTGAILTVNALPVVTLSSLDLSLIPGQSTSITATSTPAAAAGGWVWSYNGNTISGNNTNTVSGITVDQLGAYHATVTDINGCSNTSADLVVSAEASDRLWIYPNPTEGAFQVRLYYDPGTTAELRRVFLYNAQGQLIESRDFALTNSAPYLRMDFDLSREARGVYLIKVVHQYTGRIISGLIVRQ